MANNNDVLKQAISQLFSSQSTRPVQNTDLAQFILTHSLGGGKTISADIASKQGAESESPSLLSKVFDDLSTPLYGVTNIINDSINAVKEANKKNENAGFGKRLLNTLGGETGDILGSIGKDVAGTGARLVGNQLDILGQVTGLDKAPVVGGLENKLESGLGNIANNLTPRMMSSQILDKQFGVHNKFAKYGGGFVSDVLLDPVTYVPGPDIIALLKKGKAAKRAAQGFRTDEMIASDAAKTSDQKLTEAAATGAQPGITSSAPIMPTPKLNLSLQQSPAEMALGKSLAPQVNPSEITRPIKSATDIIPNPVPVADQFDQGLPQSILGSPKDLADMQALRRTDNATRAANVRWGKPIDWHDIPNMTPEEKAAWSDSMRQGKMAKKGIVSDGKGNISNVAATDVIENIKNGITPRFGPTPVGAEGTAAERAVKIAERTAGNLGKESRKGISNKILTPVDQTNLLNSLRSEAGKIVNEQFAAKPTRVLNPKQQAVADGIKTWLKDTGTVASKDIIQRELSKVKNISKADAKAIARDFHPPEATRNFASTPLGKRQANILAQQMLKNAEDHLISKGIRPTYWNGMQVRLSEVLADVGTDKGVKYSKEIMDAFNTKDLSKLTDPAVHDAVAKAIARRSLSMSDMLSGLSEKTLQVKNDVLSKYNYPTPVAEHILGNLPKQASEAAQSIGATSSEGKAMADHIKNLINSDRLPEQEFFDKINTKIATALMDGTSTVEQRTAANVLINKMLKETPLDAITGNKVLDGLFTRLSTWKGRPEEIKRFSQDAFLHAEINATYRGQFFRHMGTNYTPEQLKRGFTLAQQPDALKLAADGVETDPQILEVANVYKNYFEWALGSTGFSDIKDLANVTSVKSGMVMADLNKHLKAVGSHFQFTDVKNGKYYHAAGSIPRDYSQKGLGWMHSWENAKPIEYGQDPLSFMYDIDIAMQRTVAEYATFDEFARRFGARVGDAHYDPAIHKATIPNQRLAGFQFHPEVQKEMLRLMKDLESAAWAPSSAMMRNVIKATRVWKSSVTIYRPIHHIRNVIGDAFNMWIAGHNNPTAFSRAIKVLETQKPRYAEALKSNSIDNLKSLIDTKSLDVMSMLKPEVKASDAIIKKAGVKIDSEQLWASGYKRGLFLTYNRIEDLFGQTPMGNLFGTSPERSVMKTLVAPFGGRAHNVATKISEHREHFVRMAHYISAVEKGLSKKGPQDLEKIFDDAAYEVRKYHPDGTDLAQFEQRARVVIPFYAWTRKEIPLLAQAMVERPAKLVAYPRAQRALAGMSGIPVNEDQGMLDPYPNDQLFPDWIRASGIGPIGDPQSNNPVARFWGSFGAKILGGGGPEGYVSINPSNPFQDVTTQLFGFGGPQDAMRANVNALNPMLQIPASLAFDKTFSGAPISKENGGEGVTDYLMRQIPQYGEFSRLSGVNRNDRADVVGKTKQNLINFFTGMGVLGSGPYQKSAEFESKNRAKNAKSN